MATVARKVKGGKWYAIFTDHTGKQKWKTGYTEKAETIRLAQRLEDEQRKIKLGDVDPQAVVRRVERAKPASEHINHYKTTLQARGSSVNHVRYTISDIRAFFTFSQLDNATAVQRNHVDRWVMSLKAAEDSMNTVNRRVGSLQAFLRHLQSNGALTEYTLNKYGKQRTKGTEKRKRRALSAEEVKLLLEHAPIERKEIYRFALLTGFRFSEILSMKPGNFNLVQKTVTVWANDAKNKKKDQTIPLHPALVQTLQTLIASKGSEEPIFAMMRREDAAKLVRVDCERAKVDTSHIDFHALRHTMITRLAEGNVHPKILQVLARHSSIETTLNHYTHFKQLDEHTAIASLPA